MSDLQKRNTDIMIAECKRMQAKGEKLEGMIEAQNAKIATLTDQVADLKKEVIMATVNARGHGSTVPS